MSTPESEDFNLEAVPALSVEIEEEFFDDLEGLEMSSARGGGGVRKTRIEETLDVTRYAASPVGRYAGRKGVLNSMRGRTFAYDRRADALAAGKADWKDWTRWIFVTPTGKAETVDGVKTGKIVVIYSEVEAGNLSRVRTLKCSMKPSMLIKYARDVEVWAEALVDFNEGLEKSEVLSIVDLDAEKIVEFSGALPLSKFPE